MWQWVRYTGGGGGHLWPRGPWGGFTRWSFYSNFTTRKCVLFAIKSSLLILDFLIFLVLVSQENVFPSVSFDPVMFVYLVLIPVM